MRYAAYAPRGWHALVRARGAVSAKVPASAGVSGEPEAEALSGDKAGYGVGGASAPNTEFLFTFHREEEVGEVSCWRQPIEESGYSRCSGPLPMEVGRFRSPNGRGRSP